MCRGFLVDILYSIPGRVYVKEDDILKILEKCKFVESSGRFFGILEFDIRSLVKKLSRFSIPGFVIRCLISGNMATLYASVRGTEIDVLPIIYLDSKLRVRESPQLLEICSIIVSNDLLVLLEFVAK